MSPVRLNSTSEIDPAASIALIKAQDERYSEPMRKFFLQGGTTVLLNQKSPAPPDYLLLVGGVSFVKENLAAIGGPPSKTLILLWGSPEELRLPEKSSPKLVLLDSLPPSEDEVSEILNFFFIGSAGVLDLRKHPVRKPADQRIAPLEGETRDSDEDRIQATIQAVFSSHRRGTKGEKIRPGPSRRGLTGILAVLGLWLVPLFWCAVCFGLTLLSLKWGAWSLSRGQSGWADSGLQIGIWSNRQTNDLVNFSGAFLGLFGKESRLRPLEELNVILKESLEAEEDFNRTFSKARLVANSLLAASETDRVNTSPIAGLSELRTELFALENRLALVSASLADLIHKSSFPFAWIPVRRLGQKELQKLNMVRESLAATERLFTLYPLAAGFKEQKTYLVLLQNNQELRPTGGFIGSLAVLTLTAGRLTDLDVQDVYTLDGQLKGHVDPPRPIREILEQEHWYLRDSNWDPDFKKSAAQAAWFYEKETGKQVDGVWGINTGLVVDLLRLTGPLTLPDYNDRITADNFFGKSLYYTQNDFFPGSTQKKDFLGNLTRVLLNKLTTGGGVSPLSMLKTILEALARRDLIFYFTEPQLAALVAQSGWAGTVPREASCLGITHCLAEDLYLIEANLGVSKANYFVQRQGAWQVTFDESGTPTMTLTLVYRNTYRQESDSGGGAYRNYLRLILPSDATLTALNLNGASLALRTLSERSRPSFPYAEEENQGTSKTLGLAFEVPPGQESRLTVSYQRARQLEFWPEGTTYELFLYKQPGLADSPWQIVVKHPLAWQVSPSEPKGFLAKPGLVEYNTNLSQDQVLRLKILQ